MSVAKVSEISSRLSKGSITEYQVNMMLTFVIDN